MIMMYHRWCAIHCCTLHGYGSGARKQSSALLAFTGNISTDAIGACALQHTGVNLEDLQKLLGRGMIRRSFLPEAKEHGAPLVEHKCGTQLPVYGNRREQNAHAQG